MQVGYRMSAYMGIRAAKELDQVSYNLANASTVGFKRERLYLWEMQSPADLSSAAGDHPGIYLDVLGRDFGQGPLHITENETDLAIEGPGFFKVETPQGMRYTRNGAFTMNTDKQLVTREGFPVLGKNGPLNLDSRDQKFAFDEEGGLHLDQSLSDQLLVVTFPNPQALAAVGDSYFAAGPEAGEEQPAEGYRVRQGAVEESNVELAQESVNLIAIHRAYDAYMKVLETFAAADRKVVEEIGQ